jgi:hypothetical protein
MFHADLHIHSKFSRACSRDCDIPHLAAGALRKGISVLGTGDFTHPAWRDELKGTLFPQKRACCACGPISKVTCAGRCRLCVSNRCDSCSRWRSPLSIAVMSTHVKCITLYTLRRSRRRTASPHLRRRSATSRRMGGPSSGLTHETCSRSRLKQGPAATWFRHISGHLGSLFLVPRPVSTRSPTATASLPGKYSRWRQACPRIRA